MNAGGHGVKLAGSNHNKVIRGRWFESVRDYYRGSMTEIKVGSVWMKKHREWGSEAGQLIIVESVGTKVSYRYVMQSIHGPASWPKDVFIKRMELIKDV